MHKIDNLGEIERLIKKHRFVGTQFRLNVVADADTYALPSGRLALKKRINSDIKKEGELLDAVKKHQPWIDQITINKTLKCCKHVDKNKGKSLIGMFGDYTGGAMCIETVDGIERFTERGVWYEFDGRNPHWTEDFEGERFSIVAYCKH